MSSTSWKSQCVEQRGVGARISYGVRRWSRAPVATCIVHPGLSSCGIAIDIASWVITLR